MLCQYNKYFYYIPVNYEDANDDIIIIMKI